MEKKTAFNLEKLKEVAKPRSQSNIENKEWVLRSQEIAISVHYYLHENSISQSELARRMGVSISYVAKILSGNENLTLDMICKLEKALGKQLINVYKPYEYNLSKPYIINK